MPLTCGNDKLIMKQLEDGQVWKSPEFQKEC